MIILEDFDARQITEEALSASKEIICLIPAGGLADPTGFKQVEILCRFADEQDLAVLTWQSMVFVRRSFLAKVGLSSSTLSGVVSDLIKMAQQHCL